MHRTRSRPAMMALAVAVVIASCGDATGLAAPCLRPAPLDGERDPDAPGYIVLYHDGVDAAAETSRLSERYDFTTRHEWTFGFSAELTQAALGGVRCAESVRSVSHNAIVVITDG